MTRDVTNVFAFYHQDYFSVMPEKDSRCHADDQPFVTLHEMTHLSQIKGTEDYGGYGYQAVRRLTAAQNLNHADTYALFANGEDSHHCISSFGSGL
jgi:deuterolysin